MLKDLILKNRSYRRFFEEHNIPETTLRELVELARLSPSSANRQPLKFILSSTPETNNRIFPSLSWAAYLTGWNGPDPGERPSAYIIILHDNHITGIPSCDHGIVAQSMLLGATEKGLGGCMLGAIQRKKLAKELNLPDHLEILLVVALGKPKETVVLENVDHNQDIRYWRDEQKTHHVPKRSLEELILPIK